MSLFEVYDPFTFYSNLSLNWVFVGLVFVGVFLSYWLVLGSWFFVFSLLIDQLILEFSNFYLTNKFKVSLILYLGLFFYLLLINIVSLIPYTFASTAHFVFSVSLGFPFWLGMMFLGWLNFTNSMFCHLIPIGTPVVLISFMVLIETVSNMIRPWSLSIRLMANMISGHLLMSLLGDCGLGLLGLQFFLFGFEFFVCFIQAYVFSALLTLYSGEI